jgi:gas vesicle protein
MRDATSTLKILGGVLLGGLVATCVTLLVAPRSGKQTRHRIQGKLLVAGQRARMALEDTRDQVKDKTRQWASGANHEINQTGKEIWHRGSQFVKRNGSLVDDWAEKVQERL